MPQNIEAPQDLGQEYLQYAELNPAYRISDDMDPTIRAEIIAVFFKDPETKDPETLKSHQPFVVNRKLREVQVIVRSKIAQLLENELWRRKGPATEKEWNDSPRTLVKTLIEILCHQSERMAFSMEELETAEDREQAIKSIPIDPRQITDTLLESLGLDEYLPPGKRSSYEEKLKRRVEAIPAIREMLIGLEPIKMPGEEDLRDSEIKYFRMMRIGRGRSRGKILRTRQEEDSKIVYLTDIMCAERSGKKIRANYDSEVERLIQLDTVINDVHGRLAYWSDVKRSGELNALKDRLLKVVRSLKSVRTEEKVEYRRKIRRCMGVRDRSGKLNPGATRAALVVTKKYLDRRLRRIGENRGIFTKDDVVARVLVRNEARKSPMVNFKETVEKHDGKLVIFRAEPPSEAEKEKIIRNLKTLQAHAQEVIYEPFLSFTEKLIDQTNKVISALEEGMGEDAKREFMKAYLVAKIYDVFLALQRMYRKISLKGEALNAERVLGQLGNIHREFSRHKVTTVIETKEYDEPFKKMHELIRELQNILRNLIYKNPDVRRKPKPKREFSREEKEECFEDMKELINKFDFPAFVRELPDSMPEGSSDADSYSAISPSSQPALPPAD